MVVALVIYPFILKYISAYLVLTDQVRYIYKIGHQEMYLPLITCKKYKADNKYYIL